MASNTAAPSPVQTAWHWLHAEAFRCRYSQADGAEVDQFLHKTWTDGLSQQHRAAILPVLTTLRDAVWNANCANAAVEAAPIFHPERWMEVPPRMLDMVVDSLAPIDHVLVLYREVIAAKMALRDAALAVDRVRKDHGPQELLTAEGEAFMEGALAHLDQELPNLRERLRELEQIAPKVREFEAEWRDKRRTAGTPTGVGWIGSWFLGAGSFGQARLWIRQNAAGDIVDRLVVKDASISNAMAGEDEAWIEQDGVYVPTEVEAPRRLGGKDGSVSVIRIRGWRELYEKNAYRILMEYYPYGDLTDLMKYGEPYFKAKRIHIPEPFLWYVFEQMAMAGLLMERGSIHDNVSLQDWQQIYHSDIKLGNVMVGAPNPLKYPGYPTPVMGDWGFAQLVPRGHQRMGRGGTVTCCSPENTGPYITKDNMLIYDPKLNPKSDVWSVGNVIMGLMAWEDGLEKFNFRKDPTPRDLTLRGYRGAYNENLINLVERCMQYHPEDRIGFHEMLKAIRWYTGGQEDPQRDLAYGLRNRRAGNDPVWYHPRVLVPLPQERFGLYSKLAPHVPDRAAHEPLPPHPARDLDMDRDMDGPTSAERDNDVWWQGRKRHAQTRTRREHQRWLTELKTPVPEGTFTVPDDSSDGSNSDDIDYTVPDGIPPAEVNAFVVSGNADVPAREYSFAPGDDGAFQAIDPALLGLQPGGSRSADAGASSPQPPSPPTRRRPPPPPPTPEQRQQAEQNPVNRAPVERTTVMTTSMRGRRSSRAHSGAKPPKVPPRPNRKNRDSAAPRERRRTRSLSPERKPDVSPKTSPSVRQRNSTQDERRLTYKAERERRRGESESEDP